MAEEDEVDILGDFDEHDLVENNTVPTYTEMGFTGCQNTLLPSAEHGNWLHSEGTFVKLETNCESSTHDRNLPNSFLLQKTPPLKNRKQPWTPEERALFEKGMLLYGRRWTKISRLIGTRTTLQVKNYATHYFKMLVKAETSSAAAAKPNVDPIEVSPREASTSLLEATFAGVSTFMQNDDDEVDVVVDVLGDDQRVVNCSTDNLPANSSSENIFSEAGYESKPLQLFEATVPLQNVETDSDNKRNVTNSLLNSKSELTDPEPSKVHDCFVPSPNFPVSPVPPLSSDVGDSTARSDLDGFTTDSCSRDVNNTSKDNNVQQTDTVTLDDNHQELVLDPPTHEVVVDCTTVTDEEKDIHHEFFEGRFPKTPERYMRIRNYILDMWEKSKPKYLNKTCVRSGLRNCGDVNSIGRIHAYLELKGAINFGCEQAVYNRPISFSSVSSKTNKVAVTGNLKEIVGSRKRKSPFDSVFQIFEGGQGGVTIEHTEDGDKVVSCPEAKAVVKPRANPFRLIPCTSFSPDSEAPYSVVIHVEAVVIMDIHAHTSNTEVIGLLGGFYNVDSRQLEIVIAKPCHSLSTGRQCEMDPVSQTEASQALEALGLAVVGWYHSHPTFLPHPSLRDLETQAKYQEWFGQHRNPFVAVIVSPYSGPLVSKILCMIVGEAKEEASHRPPFQLATSFSGASFRPDQCLTGVEMLLREFVEEATAVAMDTAFAAKPEYTLLRKMLASVESHLLKAEVFSSCGFIDSLHQLMARRDTSLSRCGDSQV